MENANYEKIKAWSSGKCAKCGKTHKKGGPVWREVDPGMEFSTMIVGLVFCTRKCAKSGPSLGWPFF